MTVSSTTSRVDYTGNGSTTAFAVPFYFLDNTHLLVLSTVISTGVSTTLVLNTDYTVSGAGVPSGGTVTVTAAPSSGVKLSILRNIPLTQLVDYQPNDPFPANTHEMALDKLTMEMQQLSEAQSRALTLSQSTTGISAQLPPAVSNAIIGFNGSADALITINPSNLLTVAGSSGFSYQQFNGTGAQTAYTLNENVGSIGNLEIFISGVRQRPTIDYLVSGTNLTFVSAPPSGTNNILARWGQTLGIGIPSDTSVSTAKIADANVTTAKIADANVTTAKLANSAVTTAKIADANVTLAKLSTTGTPDSTKYLRGDGLWNTPQAGFSGATSTTSAGDITLVSTSPQTQVVSMTTAAKFVILPDATTMVTKGGPAFIIQNKGQYPFSIKNSAGSIVAGPIYYGQSAQMDLVDNSTAAGTWSFVNQSNVASIGPVNASTISLADAGNAANTFSEPRVVVMSSTQALIFYNDTSVTTTTKVVLATISGTSVSYGTPVSVATNSGQLSVIQAASLSSSTAVVTIYNSSSAFALAYGVNLSGSTITVGTGVTVCISSLSTFPINVYADSATSGVICYSLDNGTNSITGLLPFTISGTTITTGTAVPLISTATGTTYPTSTCVKLASGTFVVIYTNTSTNIGYIRPFTLSGNVVTLGTLSTYTNYKVFYNIYQFNTILPGGIALSSTCALFSLGYLWLIVNISGTAVSSIAYGSFSSPSVPALGITSSGNPSPLGSGYGMYGDNSGVIIAYTGNPTQYGGTIYVGNCGMTYALSSAQIDSTTNIVAGWYNGLLATCIVKAL